ncbi:ATPase, T2SS/T4P/T4SS family [Paenibacillus sp.]|uniref:ATPase, T2SS/T4P/T4SS family n=1 Tax=Paenibacillus sp. TaxID=58172 RepID=UPI002D3C8797|nr:ATPase, T2SS/T4P/T4SS family [Paenibacillus sp.]HZG86136.1 ATPase, T2SS/T4P/T4SS family [Paenibacillus sp.]
MTGLSMRPRARFDPAKYRRELLQAERSAPGGEAQRTVSLQEASRIVYERLTERSKRDESLYNDILNAGLGEPGAQARMKATIDTLLSEFRLEIDPSTMIDDLSPTDCVFATACGAGLIEDLKQQPDVEEVQVIGRSIYVIREGRQTLHHRTFSSLEEVRLVQDRLALCGKKPISERQPFVQSYLWNRSRLVMTREPYTDVPSIHIRNFIVKDVTLAKLVELGTIDARTAELLALLVRYHASFLIGGGTNTGKTTFLYALASEIPEEERIRTLEKEFEIALRERLGGRRNILAARETLEADLPMEEAFKPLLVMSPEWVIVGEAKGAEVAQMVQGALRGHDVMGTMHTKYRESFLSDVVDMLKQDGRSHDTLDAKRRIARAFNILIFLRLVKDGERMRRVATEVTELHVDEDGKPAAKPLVLWDYERKTWTFTGTSLSAPLRNHLLSRGADPEPFRRLGVWP